MKKIIILLVVITAFAFADSLTLWWNNTGTNWVRQGGKTARCLKFGANPISIDTTNIVSTPITIKNYADVGQWMCYELTGGKDITHYVRRPGIFAGIAFGLKFASNCSLSVDFADFSDLAKGADNIPIEYAFDTGLWDDPGDITTEWMTPTTLNGLPAIRSSAEDMHFWQRITVGNMAKRGVYKDEDATITLTLFEQATWINPTSGEYGTLP